MKPLIDTNYFIQHADAMQYIKLSAGSPAFYSTYEPIPHGESAFEQLRKTLLVAVDEIFFTTWYMEPDMELSRNDWDKPVLSRSQSVLETILVLKAKSGVIVRGLVWNFLNLKITEAPFDWMAPTSIQAGLDVSGNIVMKKVRKLNSILQSINKLNSIEVVNHPLPFATSAVLGISFPLGGAHHQKIWIVRSGEKLVSFVGGMNLRQHDWDTGDHLVLDQRRNPANMEGSERKKRETAKEDPTYPPRHDWVVRMEGQAAFRTLEEFKKRWEMAGKGQLPIMTLGKVLTTGKLFVQKSHTYPIAYGGGSQEILQAYEHAFRQAKKYIYIENQYWTSEYLTKVLMKQLSANHDLHIVMVLPDKAEDFLVGKYIACEQWFLLSQMWKVAGKSRVRAYVMYRKHPVKNIYVNIYVHAKIAIVDDLWASIGSANTNNRSMFIDTECNVQVAHRDIVKGLRKMAWKEMLGDNSGENDNPILGIRLGWILCGEKNARLMEKKQALEGYIVPLREPKEVKRLPETIRMLM